jgi:hypothetical protein
MRMVKASPTIQNHHKNNERPEILSDPGRPGSPPPELLTDENKRVSLFCLWHFRAIPHPPSSHTPIPLKNRPLPPDSPLHSHLFPLESLWISADVPLVGAAKFGAKVNQQPQTNAKSREETRVNEFLREPCCPSRLMVSLARKSELPLPQIRNRICPNSTISNFAAVF